MEHLEHFGLNQDPFRNDTQLAFYFASPQHTDAERRLLRGVRQGKSLSVIVGDSGCGKTTLVHHLLEGLDEGRFEASLIVMVHAGADSRWLLACIARTLGVADPAQTRVELLGQVYERLVEIREEGRRAVIVIDEAQMLTRRETLTELRGLLNLEHEENRLISLVLSGLPELERTLQLDPPLAERIDIRVELARLDEETASAYLAHRVSTAGGSEAILEPAAAAAIASLSGGLPRRMNTLADNALFEAFLAGRARVAAEDVERAAQDLAWARVEETPDPVSVLPPTPAAEPAVEAPAQPVSVPVMTTPPPAPAAVPSAPAPVRSEAAPEPVALRPLARPVSPPSRPPAPPQSVPMPESPRPSAPARGRLPLDAGTTTPAGAFGEDLSSVAAEVEAALGDDPDLGPPLESSPPRHEEPAEAQTAFLADDGSLLGGAAGWTGSEEKPDDGFSDDSLDNLFVNLVEQD